ncbi:hypothetical protein [Mitsuokella multacida]|uniref:hypothetical protein n=1 Tax=Mitsuokella multacida TaxID=52226 RepID=UPI001F31FC38|nr:hypothetical protein [Mitsuokella multacida]
MPVSVRLISPLVTPLVFNVVLPVVTESREISFFSFTVRVALPSASAVVTTPMLPVDNCVESVVPPTTLSCLPSFTFLAVVASSPLTLKPVSVVPLADASTSRLTSLILAALVSVSPPLATFLITWLPLSNPSEVRETD